MLGGRTSKVNGQGQIVQSANYCFSSIKVASIEKKTPVVGYNDTEYIYIYIYIYIYAQSITDTDYGDDIALLAKTPTHVEFLLPCLEQAVGGIGFHLNADKTEKMCCSKKGDIFSLNESSGQVHQPRKQRLIY